jgi:hypothetical protein
MAHDFPLIDVADLFIVFIPTFDKLDVEVNSFAMNGRPRCRMKGSSLPGAAGADGVWPRNGASEPVFSIFD